MVTVHWTVIQYYRTISEYTSINFDYFRIVHQIATCAYSCRYTDHVIHVVIHVLRRLQHWPCLSLQWHIPLMEKTFVCLCVAGQFIASLGLVGD